MGSFHLQAGERCTGADNDLMLGRAAEPRDQGTAYSARSYESDFSHGGQASTKEPVFATGWLGRGIETRRSEKRMRGGGVRAPRRPTLSVRCTKVEKLPRTRTVGLEPADGHLPLAKDAEGAKNTVTIVIAHGPLPSAGRSNSTQSALEHSCRSSVPAAGHEQAMLGWRVEWLPDMDWFASGKSRRDRARRAPSPLRFVELRSHPCPSSKLHRNLAARHGFEP